MRVSAVAVKGSEPGAGDGLATLLGDRKEIISAAAAPG
jgi:hypothetical protein